MQFQRLVQQVDAMLPFHGGIVQIHPPLELHRPHDRLDAGLLKTLAPEPAGVAAVKHLLVQTFQRFRRDLPTELQHRPVNCFL